MSPTCRYQLPICRSRVLLDSIPIFCPRARESQSTTCASPVSSVYSGPLLFSTFQKLNYHNCSPQQRVANLFFENRLKLSNPKLSTKMDLIHVNDRYVNNSYCQWPFCNSCKGRVFSAAKPIRGRRLLVHVSALPSR